MESRTITVPSFNAIIGSRVEGTYIEEVGKFKKLSLIMTEIQEMLPYNEKASDIYTFLKYDNPTFWKDAKRIGGICILSDDDLEIKETDWYIFEKEITERKTSLNRQSND